MEHPRYPARWCAALLLSLLATRTAHPGVPAQAERFAGRTLSAAIARLQSEGLKIIYSSDLVRPDMIVAAEPLTSTPRAILDEILEPHGLQAVQGPGDSLLILAGHPPEALGSIEGKVRALGSGRSVPEASIRIVGSDIRASADRDGKFSLSDVPAGPQTLEVSAPGLKDQRFSNIAVAPGTTTQAILELKIAPLLVEQVAVKPEAGAARGERTEPSRSVSAEEAERIPSLGDDLTRALGALPGMASADKSAALSVRGGETGETRVIVDGLEIQEPYHLKDFQQVSGIVDSKAVAMTDVLSGGFPAEYGDSMSGVLEMATDSPALAGRTSLSLGNLDSRFLTEGTFREGDGQYLASVRAWYPDATQEIVTPGGEEISPSYYDLLGKSQIRWGDGGTISGNVLVARDSLDFNGETGESADLSYHSRYAWVTLKNAPTSRFQSQTILSAGSITSERGGDAGGYQESSAQGEDRRDLHVEGIKQDWTYTFSEERILKWGLTTRLLSANYDYRSHTEEGSLPLDGGAPGTVTDRLLTASPSGLALGGYVAETFKLFGRLAMELGARWDRQTYASDSQLSPRVNLAFTPDAKSTIRAAWGRFSQSQGIHELQIEDGVDRFFPAQRSEHWVLGYERAPSSRWRFRVDAYLKEMYDLRPRYENLFNPMELLPEVESDRVRVAPDAAQSKGVEIFVETKPSAKVSAWGSYALASTEDEIDGAWVPRSWDQRHTLSAGMSLHPNDRWSFDATWLFHTGWPTTPLTAQQVVAADGSTTIEATPGPRNSERFGAYARMDAQLRRTFRLDRGNLNVFLGVTNLTDRQNACCVQSFDFAPRPDGSVDVKRNEGFWQEMVPQFGLIWEFLK